MEEPKRLRAALDAAGDAVLVVDESGRIVECNLAMARLNGYDRDAIVGRALLDVAAELGAAPAEEDGIRAALAGRSFSYVTTRRTRRGETVEVRVDVTQSEHGTVFVSQGLDAHREQRFRTARARAIARAAESLGTPKGLDETLAALAKVVVPEWSDNLLLALAGPDGALSVATVTTTEAGIAAPAVDMLPDTLADALPGSLLDESVRAGAPVLVADVGAPGLSARTRERLTRLGAGSLIVVPLSARGELVGVLCVSTQVDGRRFGQRDVELFTAIGDLAGQAIRAARLEDARRQAEGRFRAAFDHAPIGIVITRLDADGVARFVEANAAMVAISGHPLDVLTGRPATDFTHPDDRDDEARRLGSLRTAELEEASAEKRLVRPNGEVRWVYIRSAPLGDGTYVSQIQDITEHKRSRAELEHLASHDTLTGVLNRRSFEAALESALADVRRHGDRAAVMTLDVDNFKHVNDTYGHAAGDDVLRSAATALRQRLRITDQIGRLGGDEFGVILRRTDAAGAQEAGRELLQTLRDLRVPVGDRTVRLTVSAGLRALEAGDTQDGGTLLSEADMAMYDAKERGRDRLVVVRPGDAQPGGRDVLRARFRWSERIRDALEENDGDRFVLWEQPILRLADGVVDRSELLLRLVEADGQVIAPAGLLDVAERFGQIHAIDRWVVGRAIELLAVRQAAGDRRRLEVNLSGESISDASVIDGIVAQVQNATIDASALIFEVTETSTIGNLTQARDLAQRLTDLGCGFALDDFGAGFGSFAYLKHLPLEIIKIDGQFVRGMRESHADQVTVRAIVDVARSLGKQTVAEFVEDGETLELLRELGVDHAQGYFIGKPAPASEPAASPARRRRGRAGAPR